MTYHSIERRVIRLALVIILMISVASAVVSWLPDGWQLPIIVLALLLVIQLVEPVQEIHENVRYLRNINTSVTVKPHGTLNEFYNDLVHALNSATHTLDLTHIRDEPPDRFGETSSGYFDRVAEWLAGDENRSVRRVISIRSREMRAWAEELAEFTATQPRLQVRVVDWATSAPAINVAVIDGSAVFLALTGDSLQRTAGLAIEDDAVARYFLDYFANLWNAGKPLQECLGRPS